VIVRVTNDEVVLYNDAHGSLDDTTTTTARSSSEETSLLRVKVEQSSEEVNKLCEKLQTQVRKRRRRKSGDGDGDGSSSSSSSSSIRGEWMNHTQSIGW